MQLRLPTTIEGSVAATGSVTNTIAHMQGLIATREQLDLIAATAAAAFEYTKSYEATAVGVVDHLARIREHLRQATIAFEPVANISAATMGSA